MRAFLVVLGFVAVIATGCTPPVEPGGSVAVAAGSSHTCAVSAGGTVSCWGLNQSGQLGHLFNIDYPEPNPTPLRVVGLTDAVDVAAGSLHSCALRSNGSVWCWGDNFWGQLGRATNAGTHLSNAIAAPVTGLGGVVAIDAGFAATCALRSDGTVWCWGSNFLGETGDPGSLGSETNPVRTIVGGLPTVEEIAIGDGGGCALGDDGSVWCWGYNAKGQTGDTATAGTFDGHPVPAQVAGLDAVSSISSGADHSCAVEVDGDLKCWGSNLIGQLGDATVAWSANPLLVAGVQPSWVAAVAQNTCVGSTSNEVVCWGSNWYGQLGLAADTVAHPSPVTIAGLPPSIDLDTNFGTMCALSVDSDVWCWGMNELVPERVSIP